MGSYSLKFHMLTFKSVKWVIFIRKVKFFTTGSPLLCGCYWSAKNCEQKAKNLLLIFCVVLWVDKHTANPVPASVCTQVWTAQARDHRGDLGNSLSQSDAKANAAIRALLKALLFTVHKHFKFTHIPWAAKMPLLLSELNIHTGIMTNVSFWINESNSSIFAPSLWENTGEAVNKQLN